MMNRMGGGVAIVNYKWKGFVHSSFTDPMGLGILNSLDIKVGEYKFCCMNGYPSLQLGHGNSYPTRPHYPTSAVRQRSHLGQETDPCRVHAQSCPARD